MKPFGSKELRNFDDNMNRLGVTIGRQHSVYVDPEDTDSLDQRDYIMVCGVCDKLLNRFTAPDQEESWVHSNSWARYDHEAVPVQKPKDTPRVTLCDFCGRESVTDWVFKGDRVRTVTGNLGNDYGTDWGACADCAVIVDDRDLTGLIDRVMRVGPVSSKMHRKDEIQYTRHELARMLGPFISSITSKRYLGPPVVPTRLHPRLMPKLRIGLLKFWRHPELYEKLVSNGGSAVYLEDDANGELGVLRYTRDDKMPHDVYERHAHHIVTGLEVADLYWVSKDFTTLATVAAQDLTEIELSREQLPSNYGLLIWETPIGEIERPYGLAGVRGISWTLVPGGVWLNIYFQGEDGNPELNAADIADLRAEYGWLLSPNTGTGLSFTGPLSRELVDNETAATAMTMVCTLLATWFLMQQPGVAEESIAPKDKALARAHQRNHGKPLPDVRLVDLRRHAAARAEAESDAERRRISVRFMVRGHWKRQAYGPKRGLRRTIYVAPFMKGPDGAPLKSTAPTVKVLR